MVMPPMRARRRIASEARSRNADLRTLATGFGGMICRAFMRFLLNVRVLTFKFQRSSCTMTTKALG
jgi:hypothetical protein